MLVESQLDRAEKVANSGNTLVEHLSELFVSISTICKEQFVIIRKVFPPDSAIKITRMLVQRIFNDPAFGLQTRVDMILYPKPPYQPLSSVEYLGTYATFLSRLALVCTSFSFYSSFTFLV